MTTSSCCRWASRCSPASTAPIGGLFAATSVAIIPVVIVYLVFQKQFIAGIATGSGK